jgi:hypothetical protein
MNLHSWFNNVAGAGNRAGADFFERFFRQSCRGGISSAHIMKSLSDRALSVAACLAGALVLAGVPRAAAQPADYAADGTEYPVVGFLPGDQVCPDTAISTTGGIMVWQDKYTDGDGWGLSARRLDATLSGTLSSFRVNATGTADQENAKVALLKNGGAAFVWQGGVEGFQHIYSRFLSPTNTFLTTTDLQVSVYPNKTSFQEKPVLAVLNNSNVVMVWSSYNQAASNSLFDVYARIFAPAGTPVTGEVLINQFTGYNQRTPAVAALKNGGFAVAWVSEQERTLAPRNIDETNGTYHTTINQPSVDIYARLFLNSGVAMTNGAATTNEFLVDTGIAPCANPSIAAGSDGGFMVAWSQRDLVTYTNGWDVYARPFTSAGHGGTVVRLNSYLLGNQYAPHLSAIGTDYLAVWTSMGQDGSREGVYGQSLRSDSTLSGVEFRVNTTTVAQQMQPVVASDGASQFLAVWTSFTGSPNNFDLYAQRYLNASSLVVLPPMSAPYVWAPFVTVGSTYQPELAVSWAPVQGLAVSNYEVYVDGAATAAAVVASNSWTMTAANGLAGSSSHSFQVDYVIVSGQRSPLSPATVGTTWSGANYYGIPFEWMEQFYGLSFSSWPANVNAPLIPGGLSLYQVFQSGGNPLDPSTWLKQSVVPTPEGVFVTWNTQPGATYQVQSTTNFVSWSNWGSPRFAAGTNDAVNVGRGTGGYYRVNLLR